MTKAEIIAETRNATEKVLKSTALVTAENVLSDTERTVADAKVKELMTHRDAATRRMKFEAWRHNSMYSNEVYKTVAKSIDV